jgi:rsbT co-antagonist protein RsbR
MHPDDRERVIEESQIMFQQGGGSTQYRWITKDGRTIWVETHETVIKDEAGSPIGLRGVSLDITARKAAEEEQLRLHNELIQVQASTLAELSTPLIPISDRVLVMPLIGAIDSARAERVITALLHGIGAARAHIAIIDITGVPVVDSQVADALVRAARSVRLLGAEVVLTGIRPEVAQTLVSIAADLSGITTLGTLQSGIAYAMERR